SAASALQHLFCLRSRLAIRQWSLAPEQKICAASLHISANLILNHYTPAKITKNRLKRTSKSTEAEF
ncbi:MAG TPA: hypothetical protein VLE95_06200, partial [Chlamydiales bacterium]|nr:hypothetical protein [Chlamydiales bacterium]